MSSLSPPAERTPAVSEGVLQRTERLQDSCGTLDLACSSNFDECEAVVLDGLDIPVLLARMGSV